MPNAETANFAWYAPFGLLTPAQWVAMAAQRYLHVTGATSRGPRPGGGGRPQARGDQPQGLVLREADHPRGAPGISVDRRAPPPPRLLPGDRRRPGAGRHLARACTRPAFGTGGHRGRGAGCGSRPGDDDLATTATISADCPRWPWWRASCGRPPDSGPTDIQTAVLYDHFTPYVLYQLEELGFCEKGEAKEFVRDGNIELGGSLPINTHGGQLGEAYLHGMNGIAEGVRQVRGQLGQPGCPTSSTCW